MAIKSYQPTLNAAQTSDDKFRLGDYVGALVAFQVIGYNPEAVTKFGTKPEITADVTVLTGENKGKVYGDAKLWATSLVRDLATEQGETIVARIGEWRNATNSGFELHAPTAADMAVAAEELPNF